MNFNDISCVSQPTQKGQFSSTDESLALGHRLFEAFLQVQTIQQPNCNFRGYRAWQSALMHATSVLAQFALADPAEHAAGFERLQILLGGDLERHYSELEAYPYGDGQVSEFKRQVLAHLVSLDEDDWCRFRCHHALMEDRWIDAAGANTELSRAELVERYVSSCNVPLQTVQSVRGEWSPIGNLDGQPILFNARAGIYVWSSVPDADHTLQLWLSHPAYPKGWD